mmetsp:Transcript_2944/g.8423  ORF Transcript_2944/g.8423 Transcript_2944/m.8423 type:complete len:139 (+) Transcript_2944:26-442(+)
MSGTEEASEEPGEDHPLFMLSCKDSDFESSPALAALAAIIDDEAEEGREESKGDGHSKRPGAGALTPGAHLAQARRRDHRGQGRGRGIPGSRGGGAERTRHAVSQDHRPAPYAAVHKSPRPRRASLGRTQIMLALTSL